MRWRKEEEWEGKGTELIRIKNGNVSGRNRKMRIQEKEERQPW